MFYCHAIAGQQTFSVTFTLLILSFLVCLFSFFPQCFLPPGAINYTYLAPLPREYLKSIPRQLGLSSIHLLWYDEAHSMFHISPGAVHICVSSLVLHRSGTCTCTLTCWTLNSITLAIMSNAVSCRVVL